MPELQGQLRPSRERHDGSPGLRLKPPARQKAKERAHPNFKDTVTPMGVNCPMVKPPQRRGTTPYHLGWPRIRHHRHHPWQRLRWCTPQAPTTGTC
ncbi:hypothetical protein Bca4012_029045 [Brassica carinata]